MSSAIIQSTLKRRSKNKADGQEPPTLIKVQNEKKERKNEKNQDLKLQSLLV